MIAIFDAAYGDNRAAAACVLAASWESSAPNAVFYAAGTSVPAYEPGQFYKRELPLLLAAIPDEIFSCAIVDGYVWLGPDKSPGLGAHLHAALAGRIPVIGVAKTEYVSTPASSVFRGRSGRPLFVTAIGIDLDLAADRIRRMHGSGRLPTLIKRADQLARQALEPPKFE
jgi:deoxyribonuclease V